MKRLNIAALLRADVACFRVFGMRQRWKNHSTYVYTTPRPSSAVILILCHGADFTGADGHVVRARRGDVLFLPENALYSVEFFLTDTDTQPASLLLNFCLSDKSGEAVTCGAAPFLLCRDTGGHTERTMFTLIDDFPTQNTVIGKGSLLTLLSELLTTGEAQSGAERMTAAVTEYLRAHLRENPSVGAVARHFGVSESTLRRLFRAEVGMSPGDFIGREKTEQVKKLLGAPGVTVEDICDEVGFYDVSHLYKTFRKYTGMSPGAYMQKKG